MDTDSSVIGAITQKSLAQLRELRKRQVAIEAKHNLLRSQIIASYEKGAKVESGELQLSIKKRETYYPTWARLAEVLGKRMCGLLKSVLPVTMTTVVSVNPVINKASTASQCKRPQRNSIATRNTFNSFDESKAAAKAKHMERIAEHMKRR